MIFNQWITGKVGYGNRDEMMTRNKIIAIAHQEIKA